MALGGTIQNGVVVLDPGSPAVTNGTRVEIVLKTGLEPLIVKTPGVCGGRACIGNRRMPVWSLVEYRNLGGTNADILEAYPFLSEDELRAAWEYAERNETEVASDIADNDWE